MADDAEAIGLKKTSDREVTMTRVFDASREEVFGTTTDPSLVPEWWGPSVLTTTVDTMDVRVGGKWRYVQHDAEGSEYAFHGVYLEVDPPGRLVYTFEYEGMPGDVMIETAVFEDVQGKTKMTVIDVFPSKEARDASLAAGMEEGARESMDRFARLLAARPR